MHETKGMQARNVSSSEDMGPISLRTFAPGDHDMENTSCIIIEYSKTIQLDDSHNGILEHGKYIVHAN